MRITMKTARICASLTALASVTTTNALAQENCAPLRYDNADIRAFVDEIAMRTGRTFLLDPSVSGNVTIKSPPNEGVCADEAWELFQAVLRVNNFVATPFGEGNYRIVPLQEAARNSGPVNPGNSGTDLVTQIVRLRYVDAREAAANLAQIIGQNGVVSPVRSGNAIILVDTADNVARLREVLSSLDKDPTIYRTIALNHASADDIARVVSDMAQDISGEQNSGQKSFSVAPIQASNSILVRAEPSLMRRIQTVVGELDRFGESASELSVIYLNHADAEEIAPLLSDVANSTLSATGGDEGGVRSATDRVNVSFHKGTNSIIINGDADIQRTLKNVVAQLDIRRPQVLVEAIIVDISDFSARNLGVQYFLTGNQSNGIPFSATNFTDVQPNMLAAAGSALLRSGSFPTGIDSSDADTLASGLAETALNSLLGVNGLALGGGTDLGNGNFFGAILTAIKSDTDSNVLSTPSVVTLDNQTARLQVGQEIPVTTGEAIGDNFSNAFRTVDRQEIGVILEVTPQINEGDSVTLEITQEISSIVGALTTTSTDLILDKREITTTALVDNGDILVIGGLIDDQRDIIEDKVPFLGDIPIAGNLFKSSSKERRQRNLMVFIRPTIIRDQATAKAATRKKYDYIRGSEIMSTGEPYSELDRIVDQVTGSDSPAPRTPELRMEQSTSVVREGSAAADEDAPETRE
ncbi:MAG: type II secretion system secretin GspD [Marinicaulis sp.]|nr:type II secretion system secretin GspD [Marinicaulis sp.]